MFNKKEIKALNARIDIIFVRLEALEKVARESVEVQKRTQNIQEQALKLITTNSGRIDDVQ